MLKSIKVLIIRGLGVLLFFGVSLLLTNFFPTDEVGKYDFTRSVILIIGGLCVLGTDQAIIYYSGILLKSNKIGELKGVYTHMLVLIFTAALAIFLIFLCIPKSVINYFFDKPEAYELIFKAIVSLGPFALTLLNIDAFRAFNKTIFSEVYRNILRHFVFLVFALALLFLGKETWVTEAFLASFYFLALISTIGVYSIFNQHSDHKIVKKFSYKEIVTRSYPMAISSISFFLMQSVDIILLGKYTDFNSVAYYAVAVKVATVTSLILMSINVVIAPKIAAFFEAKETHNLKLVLKKSTRLIFVISIPVLLVLSVFSEFILKQFGPNFIIAQEVLWILLLGQLIKSMSGPVAVYFNMTGKQKILQIILIFGLVVNVLLNVLFIPKFGLKGAAIATTLSIFVWHFIAVVYIYRKDNVKTFIS